MLLLALVKEIEIIGEAATAVSEELRQATPDIPWTKIKGMRNRLIHAYSDVIAGLGPEHRGVGSAGPGRATAGPCWRPPSDRLPRLAVRGFHRPSGVRASRPLSDTPLE